MRPICLSISHEENDNETPNKPSVQVLERMFTLIDVLAAKEEPVALKEISEKTGLHPSTAHRILNDLTTGGFVDRPEAGTYRLGMRLLELGNLVKARLSVREAALPHMRLLHKQIQQPVNLSIRQGDEIVYVNAPTASAPACRWCGPLVVTQSAAPNLQRQAVFGR